MSEKKTKPEKTEAEKTEPRKSVGVIIPVFENTDHLKAAIGSVLSAKPPKGYEVRLVVVSDGDRAAFDLCAEFKGKLRALLLPRCFGPGMAINAGLKALSKCDAVCVVAADDLVGPQFLSEAVSALPGGKGSPAAVTPSMRLIGPTGADLEPDDTTLSPMYFLWNRAALKALVSFQPWLDPGPDLALRASRAGFKFVSAPEAVYRKRVNPKGVTAQSAGRFFSRRESERARFAAIENESRLRTALRVEVPEPALKL